MPRGDRSRHPYRGVSGSFRGTVGYSGVSADAQNDPAVVFPPRPVTVPAAATAPLTAGSDTINAGGGLETPVTEPFAVAPITDPAPAASLTIQEVAGQGADLVLVKNATDGVIFSINSASGVQWGDPGSNTRLTFRPDGELQAKDASGNTYLAYSPGALLLALGAQQGISIKNDADSGYDFIGIAANAAPPNAFV
jgi:hypothetical protein